MKRSKSRKPKKAYWEMTTAELREATRQFDDPKFHPKTLPVVAADRALHAQARRRGRPRVGLGAARIQLTMERALLGRVDAHAKAQGLTRAQFLARAAARELAKAS